jgi:hypothetical protein
MADGEPASFEYDVDVPLMMEMAHAKRKQTVVITSEHPQGGR